MASTYLSRTNGTETTRTKATVSFWIKYNGKSSTTCVLASSTDSNSTFYFLVEFKPDLDVQIRDGSGAVYLRRRSNALYRDVNGWYHVVVSFDSTLATADDRLKVYVNGERITSFSDNTGTVDSNYDCPLFKTNSPIKIGSDTNGGNYLEGCLTHFHATDGYAYDADTFGETDSTTGIWKPKTAPSVTYGTNGFFLKFENSGAFGTDSSGNSNTFTVNGTMTQTIDTPSNVFATWNPLDNYYQNSTFSYGNTRIVTDVTPYSANTSTLGMNSGKYYCEIKATNIYNGYSRFGITGRIATSSTVNFGTASDDYVYTASGGNKINNNSSTSYGTVWNSNDIIGIAVDLDNNYIYFSRNGTWQNSGDPTSGSSGTGSAFSLGTSSSGYYYFACSDNDNQASSNNTFDANFGNGYFGTTAVSSAQNPDDGIGIFEYDVPTGYRALCTKSINAEEYD